jgi:hypothetical protein
MPRWPAQRREAERRDPDSPRVGLGTSCIEYRVAMSLVAPGALRDRSPEDSASNRFGDGGGGMGEQWPAGEWIQELVARIGAQPRCGAEPVRASGVGGRSGHQVNAGNQSWFEVGT